MNMELEKERITKRNAAWKTGIKLVVGSIISGAVVFYWFFWPILESISPNAESPADSQMVAPENPFTFITPEGNEIIFTDTTANQYFDKVEFVILEPKQWYISLVTEPSPVDGKAQLLICVTEFGVNGEHPPLIVNEGDPEKFNNIKAEVISLSNGVLIVTDNLSPIKQVIFNQIGGPGEMWTLRGLPGMSQID